eukprot:4059602-Prymnesium_polylepis.1
MVERRAQRVGAAPYRDRGGARCTRQRARRLEGEDGGGEVDAAEARWAVSRRRAANVGRLRPCGGRCESWAGAC